MTSIFSLLDRWAIGVARRVPRVAGMLHRFARRWAGRHNVAAIAVVIDDDGRVLVAEHAVRRRPWGLPGGWVNAHEEPATAVVREVCEETGMDVVSRRTVAAESHVGGTGGRGASGITIAYWCSPSGPTEQRLSAELLALHWLAPEEAAAKLTEFEAEAIGIAFDDWRRDRSR